MFIEKILNKLFNNSSELNLFNFFFGQYPFLLIQKLEEYAINYCLDHNIPLYYTYSDSPELKKEGEGTMGGRFIYSHIDNTLLSSKIEINYFSYSNKEKEFNCLHHDNDTLKKYSNMMYTAERVFTLFHEIGHYIEISSTGYSTEKGADLEGTRLALEVLDEMDIKTLYYFNLFFIKPKDDEHKDFDNVDFYFDLNKKELRNKYTDSLERQI